MFCPKCGAQNEKDAKFCQKCGIEMSPQSTLSEDDKKASKLGSLQIIRNATAVIGVVVIILLAVLGLGNLLGYVGLRNGSSPNTQRESISSEKNQSTNNQQVRGAASKAKAIRSTAVKVLELYFTDNNGSYLGANDATLEALETSIGFSDTQPSVNVAYVHDVAVDGYVIEVLSSDGITYTARKKNGGACIYSESR
ncbi:MAG: zinc-ribbon domain-containing protein [Actinomycetota bacterium]